MRKTRAFLAVALLLATALHAQDDTPPRITVACVDGDGKPVADAEVHVFQFRKHPDDLTDYVASGPHRTNAAGLATTAVALTHDGGRFDRWLYARVPGRLVGGARWFHFDGTPPVLPKIVMVPVRTVRGRVRVPEGFDVRTVRVRTLHATTGAFSPSGPLPRYAEFAGLRDTLPEIFDAEVAADGAFVLRDVPAQPLLYLAAEAPGLGQRQWFNAAAKDRAIPECIELTMVREAVLEGVVRDAHGKGVAALVVARRDRRSVDKTEGVRVPFEARCAADGRFRIAGLPVASYELHATHAKGRMAPQTVTLTADQPTHEVNLELEAIVEIRGAVRRQSDGAPVEGAQISVLRADDLTLLPFSARSDALGRFLLQLPPGRVRLYLAGVPAGYQQPTTDPRQLPVLDVVEDQTPPTDLVFELQPAK